MSDFFIFLLNPLGAIAWAFGCLLVLIGINIILDTLAELSSTMKGQDDE